MNSQVYDFNALRTRIKNDINTSIKDVSMMDSWIASQNTNGGWNDLKYGTLTTATGTNTFDNHLLRIWHLSAACTKNNHSKYNNTIYKEAVKKGLEYWYNSKTIDPNWWYNKIYFPQNLGEILLLMREFEGFIPRTSATGIDETKLITLFQPQAINDITYMGVGANATDIGLHYIYRGILNKDSVLLENTRTRLELTVADNIKNDLVYHDHGPQIQISSYGWVLANGIIELASYLAGTKAAFDVNSQNFSKLVSFIRETQISSIRGTSWDFSVMGRAISRVNAMNAGLNYLQRMADLIDPNNKDVYLDAIQRLNGTKTPEYNVREFNKHYWSSDYTQHARKSYLFTVRNVSTRTVEAETGNGENLKANFFSHGATFISVDGSEYKNIMPYWDWRMIPGTTFPQINQFSARTAWGTNFGKSTFVGGVSDGRYGATVLDLNYTATTTKAKKSWFYFDDEIVCLGAGISDNSGFNVRTTINQAKMLNQSYSVEKGSITEKSQSVSSTEYSNSNLLYLRNGKIAYFFPEQGNIKYTMKSQIGTWKDINSLEGSTTVESGYVFSMWFDHGINPTNGSYSYIVVPGIDTQEKAKSYDVSSIKIIQNTTEIQSVINTKLNILEAIFHKAGTLTYGDLSITVNQPCAFMLKDGTLVSVSDPSQSNSIVSVSLVKNGIEYKKFISLNTNTGDMGTTTTIDFNVPTTNTSTKTKRSKDYICFPNPVNDGLFFIQSANDAEKQFEIRNEIGQIIMRDKFSTDTKIDISIHPAGIYLIYISDKSGNYCQKIIKT